MARLRSARRSAAEEQWSGRRDQWAKELCEHGRGPQTDGNVLSNAGFEITQKAVEQGMGDEQKEPQAGDRGDVVMEVVVGVPLIAQLIEPLVFDAPAFMAEDNDRLGGNFGRWQCCDPYPF